MDILTGATLDKVYQKYSLDFMRSFSCQMPQALIGSIEMMLTFEWIPLALRSITSGIR
jgi:hypothetical protein